MTTWNRRAFLSGFLGATASCIGKLGLDSSSPIPSYSLTFCEQYLASSSSSSSNDTVCAVAVVGVRIVCLLLMIGCNAVMLGSFLDGMNESGSVAASALSTAANFCFSVSLFFVSLLLSFVVIVEEGERDFLAILWLVFYLCTLSWNMTWLHVGYIWHCSISWVCKLALDVGVHVYTCRSVAFIHSQLDDKHCNKSRSGEKEEKFLIIVIWWK